MKAIKNIATSIIIVVIALSNTGKVSAQMSEYKFNQLFDQAFKLTVSEDYEQAYPIWRQLLKADKTHGQVLYFYGVCTIKGYGLPETADMMLRRAAKVADYRNQLGRVEDRTAPVKSWFYLAEAYAESADHKLAIEAYRNYMSCIPMASLDHKREIIAKIKDMKEQQRLMAQFGNTSALANQKP